MKKTILSLMLIVISFLLFSCDFNLGDDTDFSYVAPTEAIENGTYVKAISNISDDFYRGCDVSSLLALENSGVKFYDENGNKADLFKVLAQSGVNYIRLRVWNNPYDANGHGYGGGNCDINTAITLGKRATKYGMKVLIDFHYSDFWADPSKQMVPKAWKNMTLTQKQDALYSYTVDSLNKLKNNNVNVTMVQIGNEINNGMSGETSSYNVATLLSKASQAVRSVDSNIKIALHYTDISNTDKIKGLIDQVNSLNVSYDAIGLSYYSFWHGSMNDMYNIVKHLKNTYNKEVFIAETSYVYTLDDSDCFQNSVYQSYSLVDGYPATVQGQTSNLRNVCYYANAAGASGVFYWEPAWLTVGSDQSSNSKKWEKFGSGWASSYAAEYDPKDAGQWYGGSSWDNQALFDSTGHPLASLNTYKLLKYGSKGAATDSIQNVTAYDNELNYQPDEPADEPSNPSDEPSNPSDEPSNPSDQPSNPTDDHDSTYYEDPNNLVINPSFEDSDRSMWWVSNSSITDYQLKAADAYTGSYSLHFYTDHNDSFDISQSFSVLEGGTYEFTFYAQGGDAATSTFKAVVGVNGVDTEQSFELNGWANWVKVTVTVTVPDNSAVLISVETNLNSGAWGTFDAFSFIKK